MKLSDQQNVNDCIDECLNQNPTYRYVSFCGSAPCTDGQLGSCWCSTEIGCYTATATGGWVMYAVPGKLIFGLSLTK